MDDVYEKYLDEKISHEDRTKNFIAEVDTEEEIKEIKDAVKFLLSKGVNVGNKKGFSKVDFRLRYRGKRDGNWHDTPERNATSYVLYFKTF